MGENSARADEERKRKREMLSSLPILICNKPSVRNEMIRSRKVNLIPHKLGTAINTAAAASTSIAVAAISLEQ